MRRPAAAGRARVRGADGAARRRARPDAGQLAAQGEGRGPLTHDGQPRAPDAQPAPLRPETDLTLPGETHLRHVRQLTFGGQNAEAYWSWDDSRLSLQITDDRNVPPGEHRCDQIFTLDVAPARARRSATAAVAPAATSCPATASSSSPAPSSAAPNARPSRTRSHGYVWPLYDYDIYLYDYDARSLRNLTHSPGYDAEATVSEDGRIVFTSLRSGDIELWMMDGPDGTPRQITHEPGYDGGAFFSHDGQHIVWRASRPKPGPELKEYQDLLAQGVVRPTELELFVADADGSHPVQITHNGKANFAPFFTPDDKAVIFASNMDDPQGRAFQLWMVGVDGTGLQQITHDTSGFNAFPMFSHDGQARRVQQQPQRLGAARNHVFVADWCRRRDHGGGCGRPLARATQRRPRLR